MKEDKGKLPEGCNGCGKCCADVLIASPLEIMKIRKYIRKNNIKPVNRNSIFNESQNNICPFLSVDNRCNIYSVRLNMCKNFMCKSEYKKKDIPSYENTSVISMIQTFFPDEYVTDKPTNIEKAQMILRGFQKKIYGKKT